MEHEGRILNRIYGFVKRHRIEITMIQKAERRCQKIQLNKSEYNFLER